jgi:hypothetical protein
VNRRPRLELAGPVAASPDEAAALIAAVEQFMRETAPPAAPVDPGPSPWVRTALLEGTDREPQRGLWI